MQWERREAGKKKSSRRRRTDEDIYILRPVSNYIITFHALGIPISSPFLRRLLLLPRFPLSPAGLVPIFSPLLCFVGMAVI